MVYLTNLLTSLPNLIHEIYLFGMVSGFNMNYGKLEFYLVQILDFVKSSIQSAYPFRWVQRSWRHLGVHIPLELKVFGQLYSFSE